MTIEVLKMRLLYLDSVKTSFESIPNLARLCSIEMTNIMRQITALENKQKTRMDS